MFVILRIYMINSFIKNKTHEKLFKHGENQRNTSIFFIDKNLSQLFVFNFFLIILFKKPNI